MGNEYIWGNMLFMSFKLLAIRPLKGCNKEFSKVLKENEFYTFYNDYKFTPSSNYNVIEANYIPTLPNGLFNDKVNSNINVSAIVGKNGSGKSSIVELLYAATYNLSIFKKILKSDDFEQSQSSFDLEKLGGIVTNFNPNNLNLEDIDTVNENIDILINFKNHLESKFIPQEEDILKSIENIKVQIFFTFLTDCIYVINCNDSSVKIHKMGKVDDAGKYNLNITNNSKDYFNDLKRDKNLFYSIVNNYSLYGLNSNEIGDWITSIFHKNDGYQTPIVINPMRTEGKIDINIENDLSKSRLLANILDYIKVDEKIENSFRCLVDDKVANNLILKLKLNKFKNKKGIVEFKYTNLYKEKYLLSILNSFKIHGDEKDITQTEFDRKYTDINKVEAYAVEYIFRKIEKIANVYEIERKRFDKKFSYEYSILVNDFLAILKKEESHITFKLRQAVNFLKYDYQSFSKKNNYEDIVSIPISTLSAEIYVKRQALKKEYFNGKPVLNIESKKFDLINFIPPSFFEIDIEFEKNMGRFSFLSSGEKQKIFSIGTVLYHIVNLNSIHTFFNNENERNKFEYRYLNIIFDEIELYFHPEMQRTFINDLLNRLQKIGHINIYMNIIFVTHSPFILSDIPSQNIIFLELEKDDDKNKVLISSQKQRDKTFAANIHELLTNGFFLKSTKGEFATSKINEFLEFYKKGYNSTKDSQDYNQYKTEFLEKKDFYTKLIYLVGEHYVRKILENHFEELYKHFEITYARPLSKLELEEKQRILRKELFEIDKKLGKYEEN